MLPRTRVPHPLRTKLPEKAGFTASAQNEQLLGQLLPSVNCPEVTGASRVTAALACEQRRGGTRCPSPALSWARFCSQGDGQDGIGPAATQTCAFLLQC